MDNKGFKTINHLPFRNGWSVLIAGILLRMLPETKVWMQMSTSEVADHLVVTNINATNISPRVISEKRDIYHVK